MGIETFNGLEVKNDKFYGYLKIGPFKTYDEAMMAGSMLHECFVKEMKSTGASPLKAGHNIVDITKGPADDNTKT